MAKVFSLIQEESYTGSVLMAAQFKRLQKYNQTYPIDGYEDSVDLPVHKVIGSKLKSTFSIV